MKFSAILQVWLLGATCHGFHILSPDSSFEHHTNLDDLKVFPTRTETDRPNYRSSGAGPSFPPAQGTNFTPGGTSSEILRRGRRDEVDRLLSIFGGGLHPIRQSRRHHRPSKWRPIRPHLGAAKHHGHPPPPHHRPSHFRPPHKPFRGPKHHGPFHPKQHGPPKHFPSHNDHHGVHHHFEHHEEIHHNGGDVFHDDDIHHGGNVHHSDSIVLNEDHLHLGPVEYVYDDHSLNDIHEPDFIVEVNDHKPHLEHHLHQHHHEFRPSPLDDHKNEFKPIIHDDHEDQNDFHEFGHLSGIAENNIYRDDVPFKEVHNEKDHIHDGLQPGGVKGLDPGLLTFISDKSRPYVMGLL